MLKEFKDEASVTFRNLPRIILVVIAGLLLLYLASGIYVVQANEVGLLRRFGALQKGTVKPGIHYRLPWPVEQVDRVKIREVKRIEVGFWPESEVWIGEGLIPYCITGDKNIIHNQFVIQYRITDPASYRFRSGDPERLFSGLANAMVLKVLAQRGVDPILTTGKREVELATRQALQAAIEKAGLGISIVSVETKIVEPPRMVIDAFKDIINAREEKSTAIHEAEDYHNRVLPKAKAEARKLIEEAEAYRFQRVAAAKGESERFLNLYARYRTAPEATRLRLFLNLVEEVLPKVKLYVLATDDKGRPMKLKLIRGILPTSPQIR